MGGDEGPRLVVPSALSVLCSHPRLRCKLFGDDDQITPLLAQADSDVVSRIDVNHCTQQVSMEDRPGSALRRKRDSSMWCAIASVAAGESQACVSAGNTGALMAMGISQLGTLPGIERPAICTALPTTGGRAYLLDMGANIDCDAAQLVQFATMASALVTTVERNECPRIGLLNVASEEDRGPRPVQQAADMLAQLEGLNYCGFVEGDGIYSGRYDVIVCDGFSGNVVLKSSEGAARMMVNRLLAEMEGSWLTRLAALLARPSLHRLQRAFDPANYNGATLLGLAGTIIKSHGNASQQGFANAMQVALDEVENRTIEKISQKLAQGGAGADLR